MAANPEAACPLCTQEGGALLARTAELRIVWAIEPGQPGMCRVIWHAHVREMTDLPPAARTRLMQAVFATERALRMVCQPDKINLASLGNAVPHLHWHVIPRYSRDAHFPQSIWSAAVRDVAAAPPVPSLASLAAAVGDAMTSRAAKHVT